jgi:hypothetical protein
MTNDLELRLDTGWDGKGRGKPSLHQAQHRTQLFAMTRPETRNDRKAGHGSTAGGPSSPKKGGNGKGNWGALGDEDAAPLDPRDPCYPED